MKGRELRAILVERDELRRRLTLQPVRIPRTGYSATSLASVNEPAQRVADEGDRGDFEQRVRNVDPGQKRLRSSGLRGGRRRVTDVLRPCLEAGRHLIGVRGIAGMERLWVQWHEASLREGNEPRLAWFLDQSQQEQWPQQPVPKETSGRLSRRGRNRWRPRR